MAFKDKIQFSNDNNYYSWYDFMNGRGEEEDGKNQPTWLAINKNGEKK